MSKDIDFFREPAAEREWLAQERAMQARREGVPASPGDGREQAYRQIDSLLHASDEIALPADFAERTAARAARLPRTRRSSEPQFENALLKLLAGALLLSGLVFAVLRGGPWISRDATSWSLAANPWLLALGACLVVSQAVEVVRRRITH